jgi:four helix bundle protein
LVLAIYRTSARFPREELYGLTSQVRRAGYSAAANIAEGSAKRGAREFRRYLGISLASLSEVAYALRLVRDLRLMSEATYRRIMELHTRASQVTWKLYRSLAPRGGAR